MDASNVTDGLVLHHLQKMMVAERKKETAVADLRNARKAAKADGVSLKTLDAVRHLMKLDQSELADGFNETIRYARLLEVPVYSQLQLFETPEASEETMRARAYADGVRAGKLGADQATSPHDPTGPAGGEWLRGWYDGQAVLMTAIKEIPPAEPEAPKRTRRKAQEVDADLPM